jgi:hypothetical protein
MPDFGCHVWDRHAEAADRTDASDDIGCRADLLLTALPESMDRRVASLSVEPAAEVPVRSTQGLRAA